MFFVILYSATSPWLSFEFVVVKNNGHDLLHEKILKDSQYFLKNNIFFFKSCIRETLNLLTCADCSDNTKNHKKLFEEGEKKCCLLPWLTGRPLTGCLFFQ